MRVLVTGGAGLVAGYLIRAAPKTVELHLTWRSTAPPAVGTAHRVALEDAAEVAALFERVRPDLVVHTAYTAGRREDVVDAARQVATGCARTGAELVHLSSDLVFGGDAAPYVESDPLEPVDDYGHWKAEAERLVTTAVPDACITRSSIVVSADPPDGASSWLLDAVAAHRRPTLFRDEYRTPIRAADLAASIWALVAMDEHERRGAWHLPGPERLSRLELGRRVLAAHGLPADSVLEGSVHDHPRPRAVDTTLATRRSTPGPVPSPVP